MCALRRVAAWMHAASSSTSVIAGSSQAGTAGPQGRAHGIGSRSRSTAILNIIITEAETRERTALVDLQSETRV